MASLRRSSVEFQLAYLVFLTRHGLKPLSRWEGGLDDETRNAIASEGLCLDVITRRTRFGRRVHETVFAKRSRYTALYKKHFDGTRLNESADAVRMQGRLFGYPSCCVDAFIRNPYAPNTLSSGDQNILFHWACPTCRTTPLLLRDYRDIHAECLRLFGPPEEGTRNGALGLVNTLGKVAASFALVMGSTILPVAAQNPHWLPAGDDPDQDYLSYTEEILMGMNWDLPDTDQDTVLDGVQTSLFIKQLLDSLPPGVTFEEHPVYGVEDCTVCGAVINMGYITVHHSERGIGVDLPYMALHYLEHGCLKYDGTVNSGRVDVNTLKKILFSSDPPHLLPLGGEDGDTDGLIWEEEQPLGYDHSDPDTDDDSLIDGPQEAESLLKLISQLPQEVVPGQPYMLEHQMDGVEQCEICGETFNMGAVEIVNPLEGLSVTFPYVGLHTLAHGGFLYDGTLNGGRIMPIALNAVLTADGTAHWRAAEPDTDGDGLTNEEEPAFGYDPAIADENTNDIPDGRELATTMAALINVMPHEPRPDMIYCIDNYALGFYMCLTCGTHINMGYMDIINPTSGLSTTVSYYNHHFMEHGSLSTDRGGLYPRIDTIQLGNVLGMTTPSGIKTPPGDFALVNAPNPFGPGGETEIRLMIPELAPLEVTIYDVSGRKIRELFSGQAQEKSMRFFWDGVDRNGNMSAAGIYFCRVKMGQVTVSRKIVLVP